MHHPNFPQDSVLSRHFDSTVAMQREIWLTSVPSDSTLRRHNTTPAVPSAAPSSRQPRHQPARPTAIRYPAEAATAEGSAQGGGLFGWLSGLFGRRD